MTRTADPSCEQAFADWMHTIQRRTETALENALPAAEELKKHWIKKRSFLEAVTPHNETKEMVLRMAELIGYVEAKDDKSAIATAAIIIEMCDNTPHILGFHWEHIF